MNIFKQLFGSSEKVDLKDVIAEGAFLVDVRTPAEFAAGHVKGSVNIPLDKVASQLPKFANNKNIVVFCKSGGRSTMAKAILNNAGFKNVVNGKTWENVKQFVK